ncbi:hypothetical protein GCM10009718_30320 [Isoptericola halotolerans]|uniref:Uncharacterized protein n=1 Tax=Isoptericola halotolerans TaxID=300560 RepID=A0ABX2A4R1_9MICO|nr:hypothetical protein [Isoptericola halotolerans]NOV97629.1 hypothetical protein [Isoptericola halotolerans]
MRTRRAGAGRLVVARGGSAGLRVRGGVEVRRRREAVLVGRAFSDVVAVIVTPGEVRVVLGPGVGRRQWA